ncbi:MAG: nucleotidyltransferase family protein [Actinomycetia bacterium]|nr:nucleotidyltransferase family protein [Actinomycetes bacterium]MCP4961241.1 nucleotidyltransferase family protein [Actinomycetes bacterium]
MTTAAVLLAAGEGSRYDGPTHKLLAPIDGSVVFERSLIPVLAAGFDEVIVVTGACELGRFIPDGVTIIDNPIWDEGQATSLAAAVDYLQAGLHDAAVIGLADQPGVTTDCWRSLRESNADLAAASYEGRQRNPVRLARSVWPELPREGDIGARQILRARSAEVERITCSGNSDDIDTLEDLRSWS